MWIKIKYRCRQCSYICCLNNYFCLFVCVSTIPTEINVNVVPIWVSKPKTMA